MNSTKWFCLIAVLLVGCEPILIPDPIDPRLPRYTETGNNVAGAFIDGDVWQSRNGILVFDAASIYVFPGRDSLAIQFKGDLRDELKSLSLIFSLQGTEVESFEDLLKLKNQKFAIDGERNSAYVNHPCTEGGTGQFYVKNATPVRETAFVISGTFGFRTSDVCPKAEITYGRFDYRINRNRFYILN